MVTETSGRPVWKRGKTMDHRSVIKQSDLFGTWPEHHAGLILVWARAALLVIFKKARDENSTCNMISYSKMQLTSRLIALAIKNVSHF